MLVSVMLIKKKTCMAVLNLIFLKFQLLKTLQSSQGQQQVNFLKDEIVHGFFEIILDYI